MLEMATPDTQIGQELVDLRRQIDALELKFSQRAVAFEQSGHWIDDGFMSAIEWIRFNCKMMSNAAADRIAVGERMTQLAESTQAMEAGDIGFAHLTVMARTSKAVGRSEERRVGKECRSR